MIYIFVVVIISLDLTFLDTVALRQFMPIHDNIWPTYSSNGVEPTCGIIKGDVQKRGTFSGAPCQEREGVKTPQLTFAEKYQILFLFSIDYLTFKRRKK